MTPKTLSRYISIRQRLLRVIDHIDFHLDRPLRLRDLADVANLSPFHFQRIYTDAVGESPTDTVRRLRMLRAARRIGERRISITEAALESGYSSVQAFSRAFSRKYGHSPSRAAPAGTAPTEPPRDLAVVTLPTRRMVAMDYSGLRADAEIAFNRLVSYAKYRGWINAATQTGVVYQGDFLSPLDQPAAFRLCIFGVGALDQASPLNLRVDTIMGGDYALWHVQGLIHDSAANYANIRNRVLAAMGWQLDGRRPVIREILDDRALTPPSLRQNYIYLPIKPLKAGQFTPRETIRAVPTTATLQ